MHWMRQYRFMKWCTAGVIPLSSPAINLSVNSEELLLRAAAAGVSPAFTLGERLESFLVDSIDSNYYGISYKSLGDTVIDTVRTAKPYFEKTANEEIVKYKIIYFYSIITSDLITHSSSPL